nr:MAG: hypothetical protein DIU66_03855 [Bacillota bacterium]
MKLHRNNGKLEKGFTLVEIAVALAIFGVVVASVLGLFAQSFFASKLSQEITAATLLAQEKIEEMKGLPFEELQNAKGFAEEIFELNAMEFRICRKIEKIDETLVKICVEVKTPSNEEVRLVTYRGNF